MPLMVGHVLCLQHEGDVHEEMDVNMLIETIMIHVHSWIHHMAIKIHYDLFSWHVPVELLMEVHCDVGSVHGCGCWP